jgi:hypothetical protein
MMLIPAGSKSTWRLVTPIFRRASTGLAPWSSECWSRILSPDTCSCSEASEQT